MSEILKNRLDMINKRSDIVEESLVNLLTAIEIIQSKVHRETKTLASCWVTSSGLINA